MEEPWQANSSVEQFLGHEPSLSGTPASFRQQKATWRLDYSLPVRGLVRNRGHMKTVGSVIHLRRSDLGHFYPCRILLVGRLKWVTLVVLLVIWDIVLVIVVIVPIWSMSMRAKVVCRASDKVVISLVSRWSIAFRLRAR